MHWQTVVVMFDRLFHSPTVMRDWIFRMIAILIAGYGVYGFDHRQIGDYLMIKLTASDRK